jgi:hypothetical protein
VGSTLRSAAAFGFHDVLLEDRDAGWFDGPASVRREAFAAARRHKNALRVHRATIDLASRFEEVVAILPWGDAPPIHRAPLARGRRQIVILGAEEAELQRLDRVHIGSLGLQSVAGPPLRLVASIALAEIARQVGRRRPMPGRPAPRLPVYEAAIPLEPGEEDVFVLEAGRLLEY